MNLARCDTDRGRCSSLLCAGKHPKSHPQDSPPDLQVRLTHAGSLASSSCTARSLPCTRCPTHPILDTADRLGRRNLDLPPLLWEFVNTWVQKNPGWEVRHYSDADCAEMVAAEFPEHAEAYHNLAKPVEKADFFRYLVGTPWCPVLVCRCLDLDQPPHRVQPPLPHRHF